MAAADPFRFQAHADVWLLVAFLTGAYVYMVRVVGPRAVPAGEPVVTRRQVVAFVAAMVMLWVASDWPIHDVGEDYLYSVHMFQHMMLSFFLPPLALLATPEWLLRVLVGEGRVYAAVRWLTRPLVAALLFNAAVVITHIPGVVNASVDSSNPALHYGLHVLVVVTALIMWMPVCGPFPELQLGPLTKMLYLFAQSILPTIPAAWLTFAEDTVYEAYNQPVRVWGLTIADDQQLAGAIMKLGGTIFLWTIIVFLWFKRFAVFSPDEQSYRRTTTPTSPAAPAPAADVLTFDDVEREFAAIPARPEPDR